MPTIATLALNFLSATNETPELRGDFIGTFGRRMKDVYELPAFADLMVFDDDSVLARCYGQRAGRETTLALIVTNAEDVAKDLTDWARSRGYGEALVQSAIDALSSLAELVPDDQDEPAERSAPAGIRLH